MWDTLNQDTLSCPNAIARKNVLANSHLKAVHLRVVVACSASLARARARARASNCQHTLVEINDLQESQLKKGQNKPDANKDQVIPKELLQLPVHIRSKFFSHRLSSIETDKKEGNSTFN